MEFLFTFFLFLVLGFLLAKSGEKCVLHLISIAKFLRIKEFVLAFFLSAFVTSLGEFFVAISSLLEKVPQLSLGDILGSNVVNLTLGIAIPCFFVKKIKIERKVIIEDLIFAFLIFLSASLSIIDGYLSSLEGLYLILLFFLYLSKIFFQKKRFKKVIDKLQTESFLSFLKRIFFFFFWGGMLLLTSYGIVILAKDLFEKFSFSLPLIGVLLISFTTSLPEIVFGIKSVRMGYPEMDIGNQIGSVCINSTLILGLLSLFCPFFVEKKGVLFLGVIFCNLCLILLLVFCFTRKEISLKEAIFLFLIYLFFVLYESFNFL